jgi:hypothetical protein
MLEHAAKHQPREASDAAELEDIVTRTDEKLSLLRRLYGLEDVPGASLAAGANRRNPHR